MLNPSMPLPAKHQLKLAAMRMQAKRDVEEGKNYHQLYAQLWVEAYDSIQVVELKRMFKISLDREV